MATTTEYGSWGRHGRHRELEADVTEFLGDQAHGFDVDGLASAYRDAINGALPEGISLVGDEFYGLYPKPDDADDTIAAAVESVDLGALAEKYDRSHETIAQFEHDGVTHDLDHLGIAYPEQWGAFAVYTDGEMVGEFTVLFPEAAYATTGQPELPPTKVLVQLARHHLAVDAGAPDRMTLDLGNRAVMAAWCGGHTPDDLGSDVLLVDTPQGRIAIANGRTVERTATGFRHLDAEMRPA